MRNVWKSKQIFEERGGINPEISYRNNNTSIHSLCVWM